MAHSSFLPEDFVEERRDRRTGFFGIALFTIVIGAVAGAFFVTNRQWVDVRTAQMEIDAETESAAKEIAEMWRLEEMRALMIEKAELARGLIEPVPRSMLLASLVNTMPDGLSLLALELKSEEIKAPRRTIAQQPRKLESKSAKAGKPGTPEPKLEPTKRRVLVTAEGVAPDDLAVSGWMGALGKVPYLSSIRLELSEEKDLNGRAVRHFKISMRIETNADARAWDGLAALAPPADGESLPDPMYHAEESTVISPTGFIAPSASITQESSKEDGQ